MNGKTDHPPVRELPSPLRLSGLVVMDVESLFAGAREIRLIHDGQEYRLRITRNGKLILTK